MSPAPEGAADLVTTSPPSPHGEGGLVRVRVDLTYDGTEFAGWARQPDVRTVQGEVEDAVARVLRLRRVSTVVAGRTDAGVHARGQVVHVDVPAGSLEASRGRYRGTPLEALVARLRGVLPADVGLRGASLAPPGFDARFSALRRAYTYRLTDDPAGAPPLRRRDVAPVDGPLDVGAMGRAGAGLLGLDDFAAFCRRREGATTVRTLQELTVRRVAEGVEGCGGAGGSPSLVVLDVVADAFCHSMVRSLVGALVSVGQGRADEAWPSRVLARRVRDGAVHVAPALGLVLERVDYPPPSGMALRAEQARTRRGTLDA